MFNKILIKIPMTFCKEIEKSMNYVCKHKRPQITKTILSKKIQCWKHHNTKLQTILQSHNKKKKTAWYWHKNRQEDQGIGIEVPEINPCIYSQLICDKGAQNT
jgi:hypothetical protein